MRVGLFGGSFDPPHVGHFLAAVDAHESLGLDRILFIPAGMQPFKHDRVHAAPEQRLDMLRLMVGRDPRFSIEPIEVERGGLSYTVETLEAFARREPDATRFLLIGQDLAEQIGTWRDPERIAQLATIAVLTRGQEGGTAATGAVPLRRVVTRRVDVSSSEIRQRCAAGRSIAGFVTEAVADYIRSAGLYR